MYWNKNELQTLPETLSLDQVRIFCHISKLTARFYLKSGLLRNDDSGQKTRCYSIKKSDLIIFLNEYERNPGRFVPPDNWYKKDGHMYPTRADSSVKRVLVSTDDYYEIEQYFKNLMQTYPDLLNVPQVSEITGYSQKTVLSWYHKKKLKYISASPRLLVPKAYSMEFILSEYYTGIHKKSNQHIVHLWNIYNRANKNLIQKEI